MAGSQDGSTEIVAMGSPTLYAMQAWTAEMEDFAEYVGKKQLATLTSATVRPILAVIQDDLDKGAVKQGMEAFLLHEYINGPGFRERCGKLDEADEANLEKILRMLTAMSNKKPAGKTKTSEPSAAPTVAQALAKKKLTGFLESRKILKFDGSETRYAPPEMKKRAIMALAGIIRSFDKEADDGGAIQMMADTGLLKTFLENADRFLCIIESTESRHTPNIDDPSLIPLLNIKIIQIAQAYQIEMEGRDTTGQRGVEQLYLNFRHRACMGKLKKCGTVQQFRDFFDAYAPRATNFHQIIKAPQNFTGLVDIRNQQETSMFVEKFDEFVTLATRDVTMSVFLRNGFILNTVESEIRDFFNNLGIDTSSSTENSKIRNMTKKIQALIKTAEQQKLTSSAIAGAMPTPDITEVRQVIDMRSTLDKLSRIARAGTPSTATRRPPPAASSQRAFDGAGGDETTTRLRYGDTEVVDVKRLGEPEPIDDADVAKTSLQKLAAWLGGFRRQRK